MKTDSAQTALVYFPHGRRRFTEYCPTGKLFEYPVSEPRQLGDKFEEIGGSIRLALDMTHLEIPIPINTGVVYAYIENRRPKFKDKFYGWALPR